MLQKIYIVFIRKKLIKNITVRPHYIINKFMEFIAFKLRYLLSIYFFYKLNYIIN